MGHLGVKSPTNEVSIRPTYEELWSRVLQLEAIAQKLQKENEELRKENQALREENRLLKEQNCLLRKQLFGSTSERSIKGSKGRGKANAGKSDSDKGSGANSSSRGSRTRSLTQQYPNAEIEDRYVTFDPPPPCEFCQSPLIDSGLEEVTEHLHSIPAKHKIIRQHRKKYKCPKCYWGLVSATLPNRIAPGSSLGDSFVFEAIIAKYYHLIPAERHAVMVSQSGFPGFPAQLVLAAHHYAAEFLKPIYLLLKQQIQGKLKALHADETPHRMLEGSETKNWFFWGFCSTDGYYYEARPTRSGDVASDFLAESECESLMSDVYSGYGKAIRKANEIRAKKGQPAIISLSCNAHARRKFTDASIAYPEEALFFIESYQKIYRLESELKVLLDLPSRKKKREEMRPIFQAMFDRASELLDAYPSRSSLVTALLYFKNNYPGFTWFLEDPDLPIDNNIAERQLRNPVIGRKTWYGTHSERGVKTSAILFSILQTCRYLKVNPRDYLQAVTQALHRGEKPFTPKDYLKFSDRAAS